MKILITGAGGMIAPELAARLSDTHEVRMSDLKAVETEHEFLLADLTDESQVAAAVDGVEAIVHLGAVTWEDDVIGTMIPSNVTGTWNLFRQAQLSGVPRVVYASTHHTVGFHHAENTLELSEDAEPRPDTFYAVTKLYGEALARLMHERYEMKISCLRIGYYMTQDRIDAGITRAKEALVLSADDFAQMVERCLTPAAPAFGIYNCISNARRPWISIEKARRELGYQPRDTVETIFGNVPAQPDLTEQDNAWLRGDIGRGPEQ